MQKLFNEVESLCGGWAQEYDPSIHSIYPPDFVMRDIDKEEVTASTGKPPYITLHDSIEASERVWVILKKNVVIAVFGIGTYNGYGIPWLLASSKMKKLVGKVSFIRKSKRVVEAFSKVYPLLQNFVLSTNIESITYLKLIGFTVLEHTPYIISDPNKHFYIFNKETLTNV